jgi:hypothetical protein
VVELQNRTKRRQILIIKRVIDAKIIYINTFHNTYHIRQRSNELLSLGLPYLIVSSEGDIVSPFDHVFIIDGLLLQRQISCAESGKKLGKGVSFVGGEPRGIGGKAVIAGI